MHYLSRKTPRILPTNADPNSHTVAKDLSNTRDQHYLKHNSKPLSHRNVDTMEVSVFMNDLIVRRLVKFAFFVTKKATLKANAELPNDLKINLWVRDLRLPSGLYLKDM